MVAAGVYLVGRMAPMLGPEVLVVVAVVGAVTALMAGLIALAQNDIKKVLAYSTVSQLGYMFLGLGCGAWHAALFHLTTHAFFKALMFLGSGSVIHACHHEQDMRRMGGLFSKIPVTGATFAVGVLAIAGFPFLSGFFSKDAILTGAYNRFPVLFWMGLASAILTAFYMTRLYVMTFLGQPRDAHVHEHAREGGPSMTVPLVALALLAAVAGYGAWHTMLLDPPEGGLIAAQHTLGTPEGLEHENHGLVAALATAAGLGGLALGWLVFSAMAVSLERLKRPVRGLERAFANKFWFDELYREVLLRPAYAIAGLFAWTDAHVVDGLVNAVADGGKKASRESGRADAVVVDGAVLGTGALALAGGSGVSRLQSGRVRLYLSLSVGAVAAVLVLQRIL
jgi:NADH-quinone oxidoreductase subunit L